MEPPNQFDSDAVRDEKLKVLRALRPMTEEDVAQLTVRGQYRAGASSEGPVAGYLEDADTTNSPTETFVAIKAAIDNWRWSGIPFYIRTGKRLPERVSEITLTFREIPHSIFGHEAGKVTSNQLVIRLQPNEGVKLSIMIKDPGPGGMRLRQIPLDMSFADSFEQRHPDAYERLLMDVIRGNPTLFMRRDEVEAAWNWIDPILDTWANSTEEPKGYIAGTWGPTASIALIERDGFTWYQETE
jgi:glucose-6-phosphate 1-dehydrogenase